MLWVGDNQISSKYKSNGHAKGAFAVVQGSKHQCAKGEITNYSWSSHQCQVARSDYQNTGVISRGQRECLPEAKGANASVY